MQKFTTIQEFQANLDGESLAIFENIRSLLFEINPSLVERIKWNAPSYALNDVDRFTLNTMNKEHIIKLVLHMGTDRKEDKKAEPVLSDNGGLIKWASDIRGILTFRTLDDIANKQDELRSIFERWLAL